MDMALNQTHLFSDQSMALPPLPPITGSQDWLSSHLMGIGDIINGGGVNFLEDQQPFYTNPQQDLHHVYPFISPDNQAPPLGLPSSSSTDLSMELSQFLSFELEKQRTEMEAYLQLQNQRLNTVLREETMQRGFLLEKYASYLVGLIQKKENELAMAKQTNMEIEQCILRTDAEVKTWQKLAMEKEAIVADLSYKLKKVQERIQMMTSGAPDANSTCGDTSEDKSITTRKTAKTYRPMGRIRGSIGNCKMCQANHSCVLLFPCKHLCCCKSCEPIVEFCPICESLKNGSMEIFLA